MTQYIGFHIDDYGDRAIPISTGATKQEAQALAITRTLQACVLHGAIQVQQQDEVDPEIFAKLTAHLNEFFATRGIS